MSKALHLAAAFAARAALTDRAAADLAVVVEEWVANVVEHGGDQQARIWARLLREGPRLTLSFSDGGAPFDPRTVAFDGPNKLRGGGAGLAMIASLTRLVSYARSGGRNRMTLEMALS